MVDLATWLVVVAIRFKLAVEAEFYGYSGDNRIQDDERTSSSGQNDTLSITHKMFICNKSQKSNCSHLQCTMEAKLVIVVAHWANVVAAIAFEVVVLDTLG